MNARSHASRLLIAALFAASASSSFAEGSSPYSASEDPLYQYHTAVPFYGQQTAKDADLHQALSAELTGDLQDDEATELDLLDLPELLTQGSGSSHRIFAKTHLAFDHGFATNIPKEEPDLEFPKMHIAYRIAF